MAARLLDGVAVATAIRAEVAPAVAGFTSKRGRPPGLGIVLVGNDPASEVYVASKLKSAGEAGLRADLHRLPATASLVDLMTVVDRLNESDACDGILVQSPLPDAMGADADWRMLSGDPATVRVALHKFGLDTKPDDPADHLNVLYMANLRTGLWKKALSLAPLESLAQLLQRVDSDRSP